MKFLILPTLTKPENNESIEFGILSAGRNKVGEQYKVAIMREAHSSITLY